MGQVIRLDTAGTADIPVETILEDARELDLQTVFVVGELPDGGLYVAGSSADAPLNGWLLDQAKAMLLRMSDPGGGDED
jgi:hypothetical protein